MLTRCSSSWDGGGCPAGSSTPASGCGALEPAASLPLSYLLGVGGSGFFFFSQMHPAQRALHDTKLINVGQAECNYLPWSLAKAGGAFLAPTRNDLGAFQGRTLAFAVQLKGRRLWLAHILLKKPPSASFAALHPLASRSVCDPTRLLPPSIHLSIHPGEVAGGGRRRLQEIAPRLAKSWVEVIKREAVVAFQGPTGWLLFIAATH